MVMSNGIASKEIYIKVALGPRRLRLRGAPHRHPLEVLSKSM